MNDKVPVIQRTRCFGTSNPTRMDYPFWLEMVCTLETGSIAWVRLKLGEDDWDRDATWSFNRFRSTRTRLPDGRIICIGGEAEDYYDPDFCIYNDVIVVHPDSRIEIYGYPREVFPPTDFHSANLWGDRIFIVGRLGYPEERGEWIPVFCLDLKTYAISRLSTGGDSPGWIFGHRSQLVGDDTLRISGGKIRRGSGKEEKHLANEMCYDLNLTSLIWAAGGPTPPASPPPDIVWPAGWEPIDADQRSLELSELMQEVPVGHPLFTADCRPLARTCGKLLWQMTDGTVRVAEMEYLARPQNTWSAPIESRTTFYESFGAWLAVRQHSGNPA